MHTEMDCITQIMISGLLVLIWNVAVEGGIGCYKCKSINGSDAACGDPFHPAASNDTGYYHRLCNETMPRHVGLFPAKYCTKIKGVNVRTKIELLIRSCGFEMLDNTCGTFMIQREEYHGCLMSCKTHACNSAPQTLHRAWLHPSSLHVAAAVLWTLCAMPKTT